MKSSCGKYGDGGGGGGGHFKACKLCFNRKRRFNVDLDLSIVIAD